MAKRLLLLQYLLTLIPSSDSSLTLIPSSDSSLTLIPSSDSSLTLIPSREAAWGSRTTVVPPSSTAIVEKGTELLKTRSIQEEPQALQFWQEGWQEPGK
jgi:hypothetical protein